MKVFTDPYRDKDIILFRRDFKGNLTNVVEAKKSSEGFIIYDEGGINFFMEL